MTRLILLLPFVLPCLLRAQLDTLFDRAAAYQHFNGVVLVKDSEQVFFEACHGVHHETGQPYTLDTPFDIGSVTKQFTAAAILHLVAADKLGLHDPINAHLGSWATRRWRQVTIHHLLTHTSGIPSVYQTAQGLPLFFPETEPVAREELVARFRSGKLLFRPGEEFSYSNSGYILLAMIIEKVSGQSYACFVQETLFDRYGLRHTQVGSAAHAARPWYGYRSEDRQRAPHYDPSWMIGAGGVYSTANDLAHWMQLIQQADFLDDELREAFLSPQARAGEGYSYGYGWQLTAAGQMAHDGATAGFVSYLGLDQATGVVCIILTNRSFADYKKWGKSSARVQAWAQQVWRSRSGEPLEMLPAKRAGAMPAGGKYQLWDTLFLELTPDHPVIKVVLNGQPAARLITNTPLSATDAAARDFHQVARLLQQKRYWRLARYCDKEMSFVAYSGLLGIGMRMITKPVGEVSQIYPYYLGEYHGLLRLRGTEGFLDLIVYFNEEGEVKGVFEHGYAPVLGEVPMAAYPIGEGQFYLDGFPYGEDSAVLKPSRDSLVVEQSGRRLELPRVWE
jgi:CubicO group peptidase (beta-lactamase class C family)